MSSNIRIIKICQFCEKEFEARKTTSRTCSDACAKKLYKQKQRDAKIERSNIETESIKIRPIEELKEKEFLSISETCKLLGVSRRTIYRIIKRSELKASKVGKRTIIKRSEIDKLLAL